MRDSFIDGVKKQGKTKVHNYKKNNNFSKMKKKN